MKKILIIVGSILTIGLVGYFGLRFITKQASPEVQADYAKNGLSISVKYCQPSKKSRIVFGDLVPYAKIWRTGANESTEITFTKDVKIAGQTLKAGTYTFFTIPNPEKWTIIFNTKVGTWGHFDYDTTLDALRVEVPSSTTNDVYEKFTISYTEADTGVNLVLAWDKTLVTIPISLG